MHRCAHRRTHAHNYTPLKIQLNLRTHAHKLIIMHSHNRVHTHTHIHTHKQAHANKHTNKHKHKHKHTIHMNMLPLAGSDRCGSPPPSRAFRHRLVPMRSSSSRRHEQNCRSTPAGGAMQEYDSAFLRTGRSFMETPNFVLALNQLLVTSRHLLCL